MTINIKNNEITSIDFLSVDEGIEFIKKFNQQESTNSWFKYDPNEVTIHPYKNKPPYTIEDPIPNPYTVCQLSTKSNV